MRLKLQFNTNDTTPIKEEIIKNIDDMHVSYDLVKPPRCTWSFYFEI